MQLRTITLLVGICFMIEDMHYLHTFNPHRENEYPPSGFQTAQMGKAGLLVGDARWFCLALFAPDE